MLQYNIGEIECDMNYTIGSFSHNYGPKTEETYRSVDSQAIQTKLGLYNITNTTLILKSNYQNQCDIIPLRTQHTLVFANKNFTSKYAIEIVLYVEECVPTNQNTLSTLTRQTNHD